MNGTVRRRVRLAVAGPGDGAVFSCLALLLDMDGTLIDSRICVERKWRAWSARHGLDSERVLRLCNGWRNEDTVRHFAPHLDVAAESARLEREEERCRDGMVAVPGARPLLECLPADQWAVVTSARRRLAEIRFGRTGLPLPRVLVTADETSRGKPDPEGYLMAAAMLGVPPEACVVVEDAMSGVMAARAAGMRVIGVGRRLDSDWALDDLRHMRVRQLPDA